MTLVGFGFIDEKFVKIICKTLEIQLKRLIKHKSIQEFDSKDAWLVTHIIYFTLSVENHIKNLAFLLITKLEQYFIILDRLQIKKHRVLFNMIYDFIIFFLDFICILESFYLLYLLSQ